MKFNYRKIASVLASAVMLSSTLGFAAAANYPAPFVSGGSADGAIIVGQSANPSDWGAAVDLGKELSAKVSSTTTTTGASTSGGDAKSLASGSDYLYLGQKLSTNVDTITKSNLKTVLADGTFTDDDDEKYDYTQYVLVSNTTDSVVTFGDASGGLTDPALILELSTDTAKPVFTLKVTFAKATPFNATASVGYPITLFGKEYTIGSDTTATSLVLNGGAGETTINVGEKPTVTVGGTSYEVSLIGISKPASSSDNYKASISVNGDTKTVTQGQTKSVGGVDVYLKDLFVTGDNAGYAVVQLGADKITFTDGSNVQIGTDNTDIDGTLVSITGGVNAMTQLQIKVAAPDSEHDYLATGKSIKDPVFGTIEMQYVDMQNAPKLNKQADTGVDDSSRKQLKLQIAGDDELSLAGLGADAIPLQYQGRLAGRSNNATVHVAEGEALKKYDVFTLNGGKNSQYLLQVTGITLRHDATGSSISFKDLINPSNDLSNIVSGDTTINDTAGTSTSFTLGDKTYTVKTLASNPNYIQIYSSDYDLTSGSGKVDVYPYVNPVDGKDMEIALAGQVTLLNVKAGTIITLPTGTYTVAAGNTSLTPSKVGLINYSISSTIAGLDSRDITIAPVSNLKDSAADGNASVIIVEEEDKTLTGSGLDVQNAVMLSTSYDGSYATAKTPVFSSTAVLDAGFDDTKYHGYIDPFGVYALKDTHDDNQAVTSLTYSINGQQMLGDIFVAETGAVVTPGGTGSGGQIAVYKDSEVSSVSSKNLIVVGGSCVNKVALKMIDSAATDAICGADFTTKTNVGSNQYLIKSMKSPYNDAKIAVLVAGFEAADTLNAIAQLKEGVATTVGTSQVYPIIGTTTPTTPTNSS